MATTKVKDEKIKKRSHLSEMITAETSSKVASYGTKDYQSNSLQFRDQKNRGKEGKNFHEAKQISCYRSNSF